MRKRGQQMAEGARTVEPVAAPPPPPPPASGLQSEPPTPQWAATIREGDTLVLGFSRMFTHDQAEHIIDRFAVAIPGVRVVIAGEVESMAVKPAEGDADA